MLFNCGFVNMEIHRRYTSVILKTSLYTEDSLRTICCFLFIYRVYNCIYDFC